VTLLLDTQAVLWIAYSPTRLSESAQIAYVGATEVLVSVLTAWEIALKLARGGLEEFSLPRDWDVRLFDGLRRQGVRTLSLEVSHCRRVQDLPFHHKDPFDRMLVAQALSIGSNILSSDTAFDAYGVRRIW
jgi:PIN domain nuclease of toxin-antitoxin system